MSGPASSLTFSRDSLTYSSLCSWPVPSIGSMWSFPLSGTGPFNMGMSINVRPLFGVASRWTYLSVVVSVTTLTFLLTDASTTITIPPPLLPPFRFSPRLLRPTDGLILGGTAITVAIGFLLGGVAGLPLLVSFVFLGCLFGVGCVALLRGGRLFFWVF